MDYFCGTPLGADSVRGNDTGQIALWTIDTNYDEMSFFVRHCYFTGGNDPYKSSKRHCGLILI